MIKFQVERFRDVFTEAIPLLHAHYDEIATNKESKPLDPDLDRYHMLEDNGMLRIYTARDDGKLVGYFVSMVMPHLHYSSTIYAMNDILYVDPAYRGTTLAYRMFKGAIKDLKENSNTTVMMIHMKVKHQFRGLLTKLGFEQTEENWEVQL